MAARAQRRLETLNYGTLEIKQIACSSIKQEPLMKMYVMKPNSSSFPIMNTAEVTLPCDCPGVETQQMTVE